MRVHRRQDTFGPVLGDYVLVAAALLAVLLVLETGATAVGCVKAAPLLLILEPEGFHRNFIHDSAKLLEITQYLHETKEKNLDNINSYS